MTATDTGKPVRLDADVHAKLRDQAFRGRTSITRLANDLLRNAILFAEAGVFTRPNITPNDLRRALDTLAKQDAEVKS